MDITEAKLLLGVGDNLNPRMLDEALDLESVHVSETGDLPRYRKAIGAYAELSVVIGLISREEARTYVAEQNASIAEMTPSLDQNLAAIRDLKAKEIRLQREVIEAIDYMHQAEAELAEVAAKLVAAEQERELATTDHLACPQARHDARSMRFKSLLKGLFSCKK